MITETDLPHARGARETGWSGTSPHTDVDEMTRRRSWAPAAAAGAATLPGHEPARAAATPPVAPPRRPSGAAVVKVVGARGGAGASTLAAALAATGARAGRRAALVDGAHTGAGVDVLLGIEEEPGLRWADLSEARGEVDPDRLLDLLPQWSGARVLSTDRLRALARPEDVEPDVLRALATACDLVVLDLPAGRAHLGAASCHALVVVARCDTLSVAGAQSLVAGLDGAPSTAVGLVCRGPAVGRLLPHDVAAATGLELWGELVTDRALEQAVEAGAGPAVRASSQRGRRRRAASATSLGGVAATLDAHVRSIADARRPVP